MGIRVAGLLAVAFLASLASPRASLAVVIHVPGDQPTVQAGLDAASPGDSVLLASGTYTWTEEGSGTVDGLIAMRSGVILAGSESDPSAVILDAEHLGRVFNCVDCGSGTRIANLTITGGSADHGGGLRLLGSPMSIDNCRITANSVSGNGGGFDIMGSTGAAMTWCILGENSALYGGGIYCTESDVGIVNCTFIGNGAGAVGGLYSLRSAPILQNTIIAFGTAGVAIGAVGGDGFVPQLTCCDLFGNAGGDWLGAVASQLDVPGNLHADPLFCYPPTANYGLRENSPCLAANNPFCDLIGALDMLCGGDPDCLVEPMAFHFIYDEWGIPQERRFTIANVDDWGPLSGSIFAYGDEFAVSPETYDLLPGEERQFTVTFAPADAIDDDVQLEIGASCAPVRCTSSWSDQFTDLAVGMTGVVYSSAAWGDYDGDGDLDVLLCGHTGSQLIARIYRNDAGAFVDIEAGLVGVRSGSLAWADYDNDGDLDALITGFSGSGNSSRIYRNDAGVFADVDAGLAAVRDSAVAWGDCDNDGDLDILLTGEDGAAAKLSVIYRNDDGAFVDSGAGLVGVSQGSAAWGDFDSDGDLDALLTGLDAADGAVAIILRNDGGSFVDIDAGLVGGVNGTAAWGDYDADGDLDILMTRAPAPGTPVRIYRNDEGVFHGVAAGFPGANGNWAAWGDYDNDGDLDVLLGGDYASRVFRNSDGQFADIGADLIGIRSGSLVWGDCDNDGDLDVLLVGEGAGYVRHARIYLNNVATPNMRPLAPANLAAEIQPDETVRFEWDAAGDAETAQPGLTDNLRVGTTPGGGEICSPLALGSGLRRVAQIGNVNHDLTWALVLLPGSYFWSVQAIDNALAGSDFAPEERVGIPTHLPNSLPSRFVLHEVVPNPFNPITTIHYDLPRASTVTLAVYDLAGRRVKVLASGETRTAGRHTATWRGRDEQDREMSSGVYLCRLEAGGFADSRRMVLLR